MAKTDKFITFLQSKPHIDAVMLCIRYLCTVHAWYFCDHACALLKTQRVIGICIQVRMDWVYSLIRLALIFEADDGNPLTTDNKQIYEKCIWINIKKMIYPQTYLIYINLVIFIESFSLITLICLLPTTFETTRIFPLFEWLHVNQYLLIRIIMKANTVSYTET